ncbi:MAG: hypothetical protein V4564_12060 [Pseudomonadota bacterium]
MQPDPLAARVGGAEGGGAESGGACPMAGTGCDAVHAVIVIVHACAPIRDVANSIETQVNGIKGSNGTLGPTNVTHARFP